LHTVLPYIIEPQDAPEFRYLGGQSDSLRIYLAWLLISGYPDAAGMIATHPHRRAHSGILKAMP
jgi:hypothetical protein